MRHLTSHLAVSDVVAVAVVVVVVVAAAAAADVETVKVAAVGTASLPLVACADW
jgi:hypothetical protein